MNSPTRDIKEEFVQWATADVSKISCNDLSFAQANMILRQLGMKPEPMPVENQVAHWGKFDKNLQSHRAILSLLRQIKWTSTHPKYGKVADIARFGAWLQSERSPVKKPLLQMTPQEVSKIIIALEGILKSLYK
ncbi:MAG: hypothetical protein V7767_11495 [Leeuwenhoekiella sp.]